MYLKDGFWCDKCNNSWNVEKYSELEATELAKTLVNCNGCMDCSFCVGCSSCKECSFCTDCSSCENCKYVFNLSNEQCMVGLNTKETEPSTEYKRISKEILEGVGIVGDYYVDSNNNKWSLGKYTLQEAKELSKGMVDSDNCTD